MKALRIIGIIIAVILVAGIIAYVALPKEVHVERSTSIDASPGEVYRELSTYKNFNDWSPWAKLDSATEYTYEGPAYGIGAKMSWVSENPNVGVGSQEIVEAREGEYIKAQMAFEEMVGNTTAEFILEPDGEGTKLTWTMDWTGITGFMKFFGPLMDGMLGAMYEQGLADFKEVIESAPEETAGITVATVEPFDYIGIAATTDMDGIADEMDESFGKLFEYTMVNGVEMAGSPLALVTDYSPESISFITAVPVSGETADLPEGVERGTNEGGLTVQSKYMGDYAGTEKAHMAIDAYLEFANYEVVGAPWEEYITNPMEEPDTSKWLTIIYYPVK